jgi:Immunity protein 26
MTQVTYPFTPKSSQKLLRGDFWAIPLSNGMYGCGRVVEHMPKGMPGAKVGFLGGVLDWHSATPPDTGSIAGAIFLCQGIMHVKAIITSGGQILGNRPLEADKLDTFTFIHGNTIQKGFTPLRSWCREDNGTLPVLSWWGYDIALSVANKHFSDTATGSA